MPQLSPDQLHDCLERAGVEVVYPRSPRDLLPLLSLLHEVNEELAKDGGQAGTHAYDMMAAVEEINAGNTAVLIELIAALVMWKTETRRNPDEMTVSFTPQDIDVMQKAYQVVAKRDGYLLTVSLVKRANPAESWLSDKEPTAGAKPQATPPDTPEAPLWALRSLSGSLFLCDSREHAERVLRGAEEHPTVPRAIMGGDLSIQNRHCLHTECPSARCMAPEVTSHA